MSGRTVARDRGGPRAADAPAAHPRPGSDMLAWCGTGRPASGREGRVTHQLVPGVRVEPGLALPVRVLPPEIGTVPDARRRRLEALADAALAELGLPAVIPVVSSWIQHQGWGRVPTMPNLNDVVPVPDPILGLAIAARRSGCVWVAARPPAVEGVEQMLPLVLLVPAPVRDRIVATVTSPDWTERVLARALDLEVTP